MKKIILTICLACVCSFAYSQTTYTPTNHYKVGNIQGFKVLIHRDVIANPQLFNRVLAETEKQLRDIKETVRSDRFIVLRNVPIWFGPDPDHVSTVGAEYHPSADWLRRNGRNPDMAGGIQVGSSTRFIRYSKSFPWMLMHELAHAYEFRKIGPENATLKQVYNQQKRLYNTYHRTNHHEYFAELTEAYFGRNDTYPFVREDIRKHDPIGYRFLQSVWGEPIRR
jgi:hypothetical protein